jgi:hypothetical protein
MSEDDVLGCPTDRDPNGAYVLRAPERDETCPSSLTGDQEWDTSARSLAGWKTGDAGRLIMEGGPVRVTHVKEIDDLERRQGGLRTRHIIP